MYYFIEEVLSVFQTYKTFITVTSIFSIQFIDQKRERGKDFEKVW